jgi:hypothetical protein
MPWLVTFIRLAFLVAAGLLAWRRPDDPAVRALVLFLSCYGLAIAMNSGLLPSAVLSLIVLQICNLGFFLIGTAAAAVFGARFPSGTARRLPGLLARVAMTFAVGVFVAIGITEWTVASANAISILNAGFLAASVLLGIFVASTLVVAYVQGAPDERQRRKWIFFVLGAGLLGPVSDLAWNAIFGFNRVIDQLTLLPLALVPVGLAYVILRHRVIDVGFVLNRAVVYTGVSIFVVGVFVIVETLLGKYVENTSHVTSVAVQLAVALALGFSIRAVHARVDRFVDNVLFRERHLAEAAIRTFAQEASYITDRGVLLARCVKTIERHARARGAGVWVAGEAGAYAAEANTFAIAPQVDENDPAVVSMRARRVSVHVRDCDSALPGALAFPMIVRGELLGILVCGQKRDDETYAPDEEDALASLAASVGHALDAIEVRELRRRLEVLAATGGGRAAF